MKNILLLFFFFAVSSITVASKLPQNLEMAFHNKHSIPVWVLLPTPNNDVVLDENAFQALPEASKNRRILHRSKPDYRDRPIEREWIERILATKVKFRTVSRYLQAISVEATKEQVEEILKIPQIRGVKPVAVGKRTKNIVEIERDSFSTTEVDSLLYGRSRAQIQQINAIPLLEQGYSGRGVIGGILDTGYRLTHNAFDSLTILAQRDFIFNDNNVANEPQDTSEQWVHGTMCLSVLGGFAPNELIGPAYRASMIVGKTEDVRSETPVEEDYYVAGLEWCDSLGARSVSTSLGYIDWYTWEDMNGDSALCTQAVDIAAARGMLVVTAAGNENGNSWNHIIAPADADSCLSVGAVDTLGIVAPFSSRGPTYDGRIKPEVAACGVRTRCAVPLNNDAFGRASGTSLATPLVGGALLLLWEKHPYWTAMMMHRAIRMTASQASNPDTILGWGIINVAAADTFSFGGNQPPVVDSLVAIRGFPNGFRLYYLVSDPENDSLVMDVRAMYGTAPSVFLGRFWVPSGEGLIELPNLTNIPAYLRVIVSDRVHIIQTNVPIIEVFVGESQRTILPENFDVQVYPNPTNSKINLKFYLPYTTNLDLIVYNIQGKKIYQKSFPAMEIGNHTFQFELLNILDSSGLFFLKMNTNHESILKKIVYVK